MENGKEQFQKHYERYRQVLERLTLMSDIFMRNVLKKPECAEYVLQVIMDNPTLKVVDLVIQKDYKNLQGRSAILDCVARDESGRQFNIEVQQENEGASPKRARYHSGLLDMNILNPGEDYEKLPETYVIFITKDDVLKKNLPIYHIRRTIQETNEIFDDHTHIIYVNSKICDDTKLGRLMHDFHCRRASDMHSTVLAQRVRELKETPEGGISMCEEMEKIYSEGRTEGRLEGRMEGRLEGRLEGRMEGQRKMALSLANMGMPSEKIAEAAGVSAEMVETWLSSSKNADK